jgi:hypothetical protein
MIKYKIDDGVVVASGKWPTTKQEAIRESRRKYRFIVKAIDAGEEPPGPLSDSCALCNLYLAADCKKCPVFEATGQKECGGSPWDWYMSSLDDWRMARAAAVAEINFLASLDEEAP